MAATPETVYARDGDAHLAYQVIGEAGPDLLFVPTATFPIDLLWDEPTVAANLRRLASFSRLITTDLLGMGSSDAVPIHDLPAMQAWTDGLVAVLDTVGSQCVSVFATAESALPAMLLSASHPHRMRSLVLWMSITTIVRLFEQSEDCHNERQTRRDRPSRSRCDRFFRGLEPVSLRGCPQKFCRSDAYLARRERSLANPRTTCSRTNA